MAPALVYKLGRSMDSYGEVYLAFICAERSGKHVAMEA